MGVTFVVFIYTISTLVNDPRKKSIKSSAEINFEGVGFKLNQVGIGAELDAFQSFTGERSSLTLNVYFPLQQYMNIILDHTL